MLRLSYKYGLISEVPPISTHLGLGVKIVVSFLVLMHTRVSSRCKVVKGVDVVIVVEPCLLNFMKLLNDRGKSRLNNIKALNVVAGNKQRLIKLYLRLSRCGLTVRRLQGQNIVFK